MLPRNILSRRHHIHSSGRTYLRDDVVPFHVEIVCHDALEEALEPIVVLGVDQPVLEDALALVAPQTDQHFWRRHGLVAAH